VRTRPLAKRKHLVAHRDLATPVEPGRELTRLMASFPGVLAVKDLRALAAAVADARRRHREVVLAFGAPALTTGCSPLLVDLVERGIVTAVATHGAGAVHDYELSMTGETAEDAAATDAEGAPGLADETAKAMGLAYKEGARTGQGLGRYLGTLIQAEKNPHARLSVLSAAARKGIPATVHVAVGADTVHIHPGISGMALGESSLIDFRTLCGVASRLDGGVWITAGSAVFLPEVGRQALAAARHLGHPVRRFTTATIDLQPDRTRPVVAAGTESVTIALAGHLEILLPLLRAAILCEMGAAS
jgi:hypothetical protein